MSKLLEEIETSFYVDSIRVNNTDAWSLFRFRVFELVRTKKLNVPNRLKKINLKTTIKLSFLLFYGLKYFLFPRKYDYLIFSSSERRKSIDGVKHDRVIEGLLGSSSALLIENPFPLLKHVCKSQIPTKSVFSESILFLLIKILSFNEKYIFEGVDVVREIEKKYTIKIPIDTTIKRFLGQRKVAKILVRKYNPKAVFFVYGSSSQGYIQEFKRQSVPVVELQHGVINENHAAYIYHSKSNREQLPDYLLTYGEYESKFFTEKNKFINSKNVFPIGNYLVDYYRGVKRKKSGESIKLVFSGQSIFDNHSLSFLNEVSEQLPEIDITFIPRNPFDVDKGSLSDDINLEIEKSIYEVLLCSDIHCTVNSSSAIDALCLGVPTVFINFKNQASLYYGGLSRYFHFVESSEKLVEFLRDFVKPPIEEVMEDSFFFVKSDHQNSIKKFLEKL